MSSKVKPWLVLGVIFVAGILTGAALTIGLASHFKHPPGVQQMKRLWMAQLVLELGLTPDQQTKIEPILTDAASKIQAVHRDEVERGSQIIKAADGQITPLLTPTQKAELQKMESEREQMFSGHIRRWAPPRNTTPGGMQHQGGPNDGGKPPPPDMPTNPPPGP